MIVSTKTFAPDLRTKKAFINQLAGFCTKFLIYEDFGSGDWEKCNSLQARRATKQQPMILIKAAILIVSLEKLILKNPNLTTAAKQANVDQLYKDVKIIPAFYKLEGFDKTVYDRLDEAAKLDCINAIQAAGFFKASYILTEMAHGYHATHDVALAVQASLSKFNLDFQVSTARRSQGSKGNTKPACKSFKLP